MEASSVTDCKAVMQLRVVEHAVDNYQQFRTGSEQVTVLNRTVTL
jgi:hypothetical protein